MIYGWNKQGFLCQNSFGKSWGNDGYFILPYDYIIGDARALVDEYNPEEEALIIPKTNKFLDFWYKILNWFINLVS
jgi:C1A family cysteine protease